MPQVRVLSPRPVAVELQYLNCNLHCYIFSPIPVNFVLYNPDSDTYGGNDTKDKIFLLSIDEISQYFPDDSTRIAYTTYRNASWWWLRAPGYYTDSAAFINIDGLIIYNGHYADLDVLGVRPDLSKSAFMPPIIMRVKNSQNLC